MKKSIVLIVSFVLAYASAYSQVDSLLVQYSETITAAELRAHLEVIASDEYEGRETGMPGQKLAMEYISNYFESLGVPKLPSGDYIQTFPLRSSSSMASTFSVDGEEFEFIEDFLFFSGFSEVDLDFNQEDLVWLGYGIEEKQYNDYAGIDVKGKVLLMMSGEPYVDGKSLITGDDSISDWSKEWRKKRELAQEKGAKAVFIMNPNYDDTKARLRYWLENPSMSLVMEEESGDEVLPTVFINRKLANALLKAGKGKLLKKWLAKMGKKGKPASKGLSLNTAVFNMETEEKQYTGENVLAYIEGSDLKEELVVITAHYDHVGIIKGEIHNGADDDGSGTVGALEIAQAFMQAKKEGNGPRRSVLVMTVSGEEKGLLGSRWYSENPVFPLDQTVCNLNIDMIGRVDDAHKDDPNYIYLIGSDKLSTHLHALSEQANSTYTNLELDYTYNDPNDPNRYYYRSDHYNFARKGIPVIFYFSGVHEDYHKPTDDVDKIMFEKMEKIVRLVFSTAWVAANQEAGLPVDVENDFD